MPTDQPPTEGDDEGPEPRLASCEPSDESRCPAWAAMYDSGGPYDFTTASATSSSGDRIFLTGIDQPQSPPADIVTVAFDRTGNQLWAAEYAGPQNRYDYPSKVAVSPDESLVVVAGGQELAFPSGGDAVAIAYDASTGEQRWVTTFDGGHGFDMATDVTFAPDGSTIYLSVISKGAGDDLDWDYITLALDAEDGHERWATRNSSTPSDGYDYALAVAASPDGATVATTGWMQAAGQEFLGYGTVAYDAATGATRWVARHDSGPPTNSVARDVAFSPDGGSVYVTGLSYQPVEGGGWKAGYVTARYDASSGAELWKDRYEVCNACNIRTLAVDPNGGRVYISGSGDRDFTAIAYDSRDGARAWTTRYDNGGNEMVVNAVLSPRGSRLYLAGVTQYHRNVGLIPLLNSYIFNDVTIAALDSGTGEVVWDARPVYEEAEDDLSHYYWDVGPNWDWAAVSTAPGRVYVTQILTRRRFSKLSPHLGLFNEIALDYLTVAFDDDEKEDAVTTPVVTFTQGNAESGQYSDETLFEARLSDSDNDPIEGVELTFELTGAESSRSFTATSDENGIARVTPTLEEKPGSYQLIVSYAGDQGAAQTTGFVVEKEDTAIALSVEGEDDDKTLRARLSDLDTSSEGITDRTIDFYSDGELIDSAVTDADGVASVALPPRHRGNNRTYEAVFEGDDFYLGSADERAGKGKGGNGGGSGGNGGGAEDGRNYAGRMLLM